MRVFALKVALTLILAAQGVTPFWCDSCGEMWDSRDAVVCEVCGSDICPICADSYDGAGCYVCEV